MYRVEIDRTLCIGYGLCAQTAPRSLRLDADGIAEAVAEIVDDEDIVEAALVCPMSAIAAHIADGHLAA
jgi:ferredoxin